MVLLPLPTVIVSAPPLPSITLLPSAPEIVSALLTPPVSTSAAEPPVMSVALVAVVLAVIVLIAVALPTIFRPFVIESAASNVTAPVEALASNTVLVLIAKASVVIETAPAPVTFRLVKAEALTNEAVVKPSVALMFHVSTPSKLGVVNTIAPTAAAPSLISVVNTSN